jgi:exodeoxyribonuclease VII large subunit
MVDADRQQIDVLTDHLDRAFYRLLERRANRLAVAQAGLTAVSPLATLARGFAIVRHADGRLIASATQATPGKAITIQLSDGSFGARVDG